MRKELGIDYWLELVKEDKNLNGDYISFAQYMYLLEKENQELKKQLEELEEHSANAINKQVARGIDLVNQQKEFIEYLEKEIVDCKAGSGQQYYAQEHLKMFKEIIGGDRNE